MRKRRLPARLLALGLAVVVGTGMAGMSEAVAAARQAPPPEVSGHAPGGQARTVTLITGDQVTVETSADGKEGVLVKPGKGRKGVSFVQRSYRDSLQVIPSDALSLVNRDVLDARLFDVRGLLRMGYDDARRATLPLIVQYAEGSSVDVARAGIARSATLGASLASVRGQAVGQRKSEATAFWASLTREANRARSLAPGVARVWLDANVQAELDQSVPQIGAPAAWQAGYRGTGVLTAVLDTGIDSTHPDLTDAVAEAADFTGNADGPKDGHGHGTHVASTITGNGAASGGKYVGVAPDTRLLVGKVLDDGGNGLQSQIIAGMEWAVARQAKVVNMSLGSRQPSDGKDPLSQAVNNLTAASGTLFVVAAGNTGGPATVSSPGAADAALTVGAVDAQDRLAAFSSRGPRLGDYAAKPEITAPGVAIAAARAAGTDLGTSVDERYTRLSGTSMATPHVAGAAAIIAQQHPDWRADQLKSALVGSAKPTGGTDVFAQGGGRVDVDRAIHQSAHASPSTVSAYLAWPHTEAVTKTVTYHNDGADPLVLNLAAEFTGQDGKPASPVRLGASQLTVPAHGSADATLIIEAGSLAPGTYGGLLTATSADGATVLHTPVSVFSEAEVFDVVVDSIDRAGQHFPETSVAMVEVDTGAPVRLKVDGERFVGRVPKGRYTLNANIGTYENDELRSVTFVSIPEVVVDRSGITVVLDARAGRPTRVEVDDPSAVTAFRQFGVSQKVAGGLDFEWRALIPDPEQVELFATPTGAVSDRPYTFVHIAIKSTPLDSSTPQRAYNLLKSHAGSVPEDPSFRVRGEELAQVTTRVHGQGVDTVGDLGNLAGFDEYGSAAGGFYSVRVPGELTQYFTAADNVFWDRAFYTGETVETTAPVHYTTGRRSVESWNRAVVGPVAQVDRCGGLLDAFIPVFSPPGTIGTVYDSVTGTATLRKDGKEIATSDDPTFVHREDLAPERAVYALRTTATRKSALSLLSPTVDAEWTFSSEGTQGGECESPGVPLLNVRVDGDFDLNNRATRLGLFPLTVTGYLTGSTNPVKLKSLVVEASYDNGATWRPAGAGRVDEATFSVLVPPAPARAKFVSLRITAADVLGNRLRQTVSRAYQLAD